MPDLRKVDWLVVIPLILLLAVGAVIAVGAENWLEARKATDVTVQRVLAAEVLLSDLKDAETGQRGYLLTGDLSYLAPYREAREHVVANYARLARLLDQPPVPAIDYGSIAPLIDEKLEELTLTIDLAQRGEHDEALTIVRSNKGKQIMDRLRSQISAIRAQTEASIAEHAERERHFWSLTMAATLALTAVAIAVVVALAQSYRKAAKALRQRGEELDTALSAANAGFWEYDPTTARVSWSAHMFPLFGLPRPSALDGPVPAATWRAVIFPADLELVDRVMREASDGRAALKLEFRVQSPNGPPRWLAAEGHRTAEGPLRGLCMDITQRKTAEQTLQAAQAQAARAAEVKSRFFAAASHDLRQPLQSMFLFASGLERYSREGPAKEMLTQLERGMGILRDLLDRLLDVSRLDSGKLEPVWNEFPISAVLLEVASMARPIAATKGIDFSISTCMATVRSDASMLGRILRNLVANALRYTERGSIEVACKTVGRSLRIEVRDTGIGIPEDQLADIWEEFHQVGNPARDREQGLGLGLAIVRRLAVMLEHPIGVDSQVGKGTTFFVDVPCIRMSEHRPAAELPTFGNERIEGRERLVLIVDDDALVLDGLRTTAEVWGFKVATARSLDEAVHQINANRCPEVVLCDYRLGERATGLDVIRQVRLLCRTQTPAILITGDTNPDLAQELQYLGIHMLYKPITPDELASALQVKGG